MKTTYKLSKLDLIYILFLSCLGTGIVLFSTANYGAGISPDSVGYLSMARNMAAGKWFIDFNAMQVNYQPFFYPFLPGLIEIITQNDPINYLNIINAFLFGGIIFLSGLLLLYNLEPNLMIARIALLWVLTSSPLYQISIYAWSEPLFVFLTLLFLFWIQKYLCNPQKKRYLLASAIAVALASNTRYVGGIEIVTGGLIILALSQKTWRGKIRDLVVFVFISSIPLTLWLVNNRISTGSLVGMEIRSLTNLTIYDNFYATIYTLISWLVPNRLIENRSFLVLSLFTGILIFLSGIVIISVVNSLRQGKKIREIVQPLASYVLFTSLYIGFMLYFSTFARISRIDDRYLSPVYVPCLLIVLVILLKFLALIKRGSARYFGKIAILIILLTGLVYPILEIRYYSIKYNQEGIDFNSQYWKNSEIINYLKDQPQQRKDQIFSNGQDLYYYYFYKNGDNLPLALYYSGIQDLQRRILQNQNEIPVQLIWFDGIHQVAEPDIIELQQNFIVYDIRKFHEGNIYSLGIKHQ